MSYNGTELLLDGTDGGLIENIALYTDPYSERINNYLNQYRVEDIVIESTLRHSDPYQQAQNVLNAFNRKKKSIMIPSVMFGTRIDRDEFRLVHRNNTPELVGYTDQPLRKKIFMTGKTEDIGVYKHIELFFGAHGVYVINVPIGKIAKAYLGNKPILLGEGPHVIHNPNFKLADSSLVAIDKEYIVHKINIILRIPQGKLCKIWIKNEPIILEYRSKPYVFKTPYFSIMEHTVDSKKSIFYHASNKLIEHGHIKRIMPRTGEVAITYDHGNLVTIPPNKNRTPIIIRSQNHIVVDFISTNIQTLVFPSDKTIVKRKKELKSDRDYCKDFIEYEEFRTRDGLPIGVKLLVVFSIVDPQKVLSRLKYNEIIPHIENLVVADMGAVIQQCTSSDFQNTAQTKTEPNIYDNKINKYKHGIPPNNPEIISHLQDSVKNKLSKDFLEYGIMLDRVNIETPKILDRAIGKKISEYSLLNSEASAKEAILEKKYTIAKKEAEREAKQIEIEQMQTNSNKISAAQAELESAKLIAEATKVKADAEAYAAKCVAKAKAEMFEQYPKLFEYKLKELHAHAIKGIKSSVISPEIAKSMFGFNSVLNLIPKIEEN